MQSQSCYDYLNEYVSYDRFRICLILSFKRQPIDCSQVDLNQILIFVSLLDVVILSLQSLLIDELDNLKRVNVLVIELTSESMQMNLVLDTQSMNRNLTISFSSLSTGSKYRMPGFIRRKPLI